MEYNPIAEMGLPEYDKQLICGSLGFIMWNSLAKDLCTKYVKNGAKLFDVMKRYETVGGFALSRQDFPSVNKMLFPFISAGGVTDHDAYAMATEKLRFLKGAERTLRYVNALLPTFINSNAYEHQMMAVCDKSGFPICNVNSMRVSFDELTLSKGDAKKIRAAGNKILGLPVSKQNYAGGKMKYLDMEDSAIVDVLDRFYEKDVQKMDSVLEASGKIPSLCTNEKAYVLLETRKRTEIGFEDTAYVGSDSTDFRAMDMVKDASGLSISFNGTEYAVMGSNVAVVGDNATVAAVLVAEFYNGGLEGVFSMLEHWDAESLRKYPCADRNLMDSMLRESGEDLPKVYKVEKSNADQIVEESLRQRAAQGL